MGLRPEGVLALTDTATDQGGFQCVPGMHRGLEEWIKTQPPDRNPRVPDLSGRTRRISEWHGKSVVCNFWATWCEPCRSSFPEYQALLARYGDELVVLGISEDDEDTGIDRFVEATEPAQPAPLMLPAPVELPVIPGMNAIPPTPISEITGRVKIPEPPPPSNSPVLTLDVPRQSTDQASVRVSGRATDADRPAQADGRMLAGAGELDHLATVTSGAFIVPWVGLIPSQPELRPTSPEVDAVLQVR